MKTVDVYILMTDGTEITFQDCSVVKSESPDEYGTERTYWLITSEKEHICGVELARFRDFAVEVVLEDRYGEETIVHKSPSPSYNITSEMRVIEHIVTSAINNINNAKYTDDNYILNRLTGILNIIESTKVHDDKD